MVGEKKSPRGRKACLWTGCGLFVSGRAEDGWMESRVLLRLWCGGRFEVHFRSSILSGHFE